MADLEFRFNLLIKSVSEVLWYVSQLGVFEILFLHTQNIAGWTIEEVRVFMGILFCIDALWMTFFIDGLGNISEDVRKGQLDLILAKPANPLFMIVFQKINSLYMINFAAAVVYLLWAFSKVPLPAVQLLWLFLVVPMGLLLQFAFRVIIASIIIRIVSAESLVFVWYSLFRVATRPDSIYPKWLKFILRSVFPLALMVSIPAELVLGKSGWLTFILSAMLLTTLCALSLWSWKSALKSYGSASS